MEVSMVNHSVRRVQTSNKDVSLCEHIKLGEFRENTISFSAFKLVYPSTIASLYLDEKKPRRSL